MYPPTTESYTLSLHDALPICERVAGSSMPDTPTTKYAKSGDVHIAYQVVGDGPNDLVFVPGWVSHVEYAWEDPFLDRKSTRLNSSHVSISYAVFCLKKKTKRT